MTRDDINKIIFDNELFHGVLTGMGVVMDIEHLEKFANIVAAAEREACAKLMDDMAAKDNLSNYYKVAANKIRARGQE